MDFNQTNVSQNTSVFYQNVMKEIYNINNNEGILKTCSIKKSPPNIICQKLISDNIYDNDSYTIDLSKSSKMVSSKTNNIDFMNNIVSQNKTCTIKYRTTNTPNEKENLAFINKENCNNVIKNMALRHVKNFRPQRHSTPVHVKNIVRDTKENHNNILNNTVVLVKSNISPLSNRNLPPEQLSNNNNSINISYKGKPNINFSLTSTIFTSINESCATLINKIKSVLRPYNESKSNCNTPNPKLKKHNHSFTSYMKKRDSILNYTENKETDINKCETCNNTIILKRKLRNDVYLKNTVKKLKIGINMYGCNFKVIDLFRSHINCLLHKIYIILLFYISEAFQIAMAERTVHDSPCALHFV